MACGGAARINRAGYDVTDEDLGDRGSRVKIDGAAARADPVANPFQGIDHALAFNSSQ